VGATLGSTLPFSILITIINEGDQMSIYQPIELFNYVNNRGITNEENTANGELSLGKSSLPLNEFPLDFKIKYRGIPFQFTYTQDGDNVELEGQSIYTYKRIKTSKVHFIGCSINGDLSDSVYFHYKGEMVDEKKLYFSDLMSSTPTFNDKKLLSFNHLHTQDGKREHYNPNLWIYTTELTQSYFVDEIKFNDNPFMHIFAITMERSE
jgi:hypothetical protein